MIVGEISYIPISNGMSLHTPLKGARMPREHGARPGLREFSATPLESNTRLEVSRRLFEVQDHHV